MSAGAIVILILVYLWLEPIVVQQITFIDQKSKQLWKLSLVIITSVQVISWHKLLVCCLFKWFFFKVYLRLSAVFLGILEQLFSAWKKSLNSKIYYLDKIWPE